MMHLVIMTLATLLALGVTYVLWGLFLAGIYIIAGHDQDLLPVVKSRFSQSLYFLAPSIVIMSLVRHYQPHPIFFKRILVFGAFGAILLSGVIMLDRFVTSYYGFKTVDICIYPPNSKIKGK